MLILMWLHDSATHFAITSIIIRNVGTYLVRKRQPWGCILFLWQVCPVGNSSLGSFSKWAGSSFGIFARWFCNTRKDGYEALNDVALVYKRSEFYKLVLVVSSSEPVNGLLRYCKLSVVNDVTQVVDSVWEQIILVQFDSDASIAM